jgi:hypothetical protein
VQTKNESLCGQYSAPPPPAAATLSYQQQISDKYCPYLILYVDWRSQKKNKYIYYGASGCCCNLVTTKVVIRIANL